MGLRLCASQRDLTLFHRLVEQTLVGAAGGRTFFVHTAAGVFELVRDGILEAVAVFGYDDADTQQLFGHPTRIMARDDLIRAKAAAGRAKDLLDLEALRRNGGPKD
ncbi:MAG: hypothetical protein ACT4TC_11900 [Myxococcaceae bacterium]